MKGVGVYEHGNFNIAQFTVYPKIDRTAIPYCKTKRILVYTSGYKITYV